MLWSRTMDYHSLWVNFHFWCSQSGNLSTPCIRICLQWKVILCESPELWLSITIPTLASQIHRSWDETTSPRSVIFCCGVTRGCAAAGIPCDETSFSHACSHGSWQDFMPGYGISWTGWNFFVWFLVHDKARQAERSSEWPEIPSHRGGSQNIGLYAWHMFSYDYS